MNNLSWRSLQAFLTLANCRQFTLAAEQFHVSQSAFSQIIARLEVQVGARLFDRHTRNVSLTAEGELLLPIAKRLAADVDDMFAELRHHTERRKGKVALAALPSLSAEWMAKVIAVFKERYPGIRLELYDVSSEQGLQFLRAGKVDFAINADTSHPEEFETRVLFKDPFFLVSLPTHPLAKRKSITFPDLADASYIGLISSSAISEQLAPYLRDVAVRESELEVEHLSTLAGLVANGIGVCVVPGTALFHFQRVGLRAVPITGKTPARSVIVMQRRGRSHSVAAKALLEIINATPPFGAA